MARLRSDRNRPGRILVTAACAILACAAVVASDALDGLTGAGTPLRKGDVISFFGDSVTMQGDGEKGYIGLLRAAVAKSEATRDLGVRLVGHGLNGGRVPTVLEGKSPWGDLGGTMEELLKKDSPTVAVVLLGINDVWHGEKGTTTEGFEAGLRAMLDLIAKVKAIPILCTPPGIGEKPHGTNPLDPKLDEYCGIVRKIAKERKLALCDLRASFGEYRKEANAEEKDRGLLTYDGVHMNDAGNSRLAEEIAKTLADVLADHRLKESSSVEATRALERDWLFQAMGEPLLERTARELQWSRELAARLIRTEPAPDLDMELRELERLGERWSELRDGGPMTPAAERVEATPSWIWYPEGDSTQDAPAATRYFRFRLEIAAKASAAELRVAADDACEVYVNGRSVGIHETWQRTAVLDVGPWLEVGENVLAVRAENRPAPSKNPAGLIARMAVTLVDGRTTTRVTDGSWRTDNTSHPQWEQPGFDDASWEAATVSASYGGGPWGKIAGLGGDVQDDPIAAYAGEDPAVRDLYFAVREAKREILFKNPVVDFTSVLFIDQPLPQGPINPEHEAIHRMGITAVSGGRILVLDGLHPGGQVRCLAPNDRPGSFWRPDLSFDARKVLFCFKPHDEPSFHLYEMGIDGSGLRQLTDSEYDDIDPLYLPDGHILFTTTRGNSYVRCGPFIYSYTLARCDADGSNVYLISHNGEPDFVPALLNDGRVIYSRWEYTDKPLWRLQKLWTTNQDGTGTAHFWGNQSVWPDHLSEPRPIPGSRRVMFSGVGHHDWWSGSIGIIDPDEGRDFPHGLTKVTVDLPWPEVTAPPVDPPEAADYHASGRFTGYKTPYPLSEEDFLVSARGLGNRFRLYLMDVHGNRELIYEGAHNAWHALPVRPRPAPPRQADRVAWPGTGEDRRPVQPGSFLSPDVYQGVPDLPRGSVRYLRVLQLDYKTYSTWNKTYRHSGPPVSIVQEEGVKRILSEVPVEADGSVHLEAPAGRALFFQLLDENYRCLQTMRSFTGLMPGERRGCVGCHEGHSSAPPTATGLALKRPASPLSPPPWGTESIGYERFAQPVLDRYCVSCHQGTEPGAAEPNLALRPGHDVFQEPYLTLVGGAGWGNPIPGGPGYGIAGAIPVESAYGQNDPSALKTLRPGTHLSYASPLVRLASSGEHHDVKADPLSLRRLMAWVDACCPYMGEPEVRRLGDPDFPGIETLPIRPRVATAPVIERP